MATYTPNYNLEKPEASDPFGNFRQSYNNNLDIIDANLGGGGGSGNVDDVEVNGVSVLNTQTHVAEITSYKEVTQAQYDALPASKLTDGIAYFIKDGGGGSGSGGSFLLMITAETGLTVTATKDGTTLTATEVSTGVYAVEVTSAGTWTLSDGTNTETVDVGIYTATLSSVPEGSTVLPTDDVSIWLACGERTEEYTTLSQVLGDNVCLSALLNNNNANDYLVRSTTWASTLTADSSAMSYIGLNNYCSNTLLSDTTWCNAICNSTYFESVLNVKVPTMTSNTTPSGVCSASTSDVQNPAYLAFDGNDSTLWSATAVTNQTLAYEFVDNVCIVKFRLIPSYTGSVGRVKNYKIQASNDNFGSDVATLYTGVANNADYSSNPIIQTISNNSQYRNYRILVVDEYGTSSQYIRISTLQFYGRKDI